MKNSTFQKQSPQKIYNKAKLFSKTITNINQIPMSLVKQNQIKNIAECIFFLNRDNKASVRFAIDQSKYQKNLYRTLQKLDSEKRNSFRNNISQKDKIITDNIAQINKKIQKHNQRKEKHFENVYKNHVLIQNNKKYQKDQDAIKLRKQLLEFYQKEKQRKRLMDTYQVNVDTCYQDAVQRIDKIHHKNQSYSIKSQIQYNKRMLRNSKKNLYLITRTNFYHANNKKKSSIQRNNSEILKDKEKHFIQVYANDRDNGNKAELYKQKQGNKIKERIHRSISQRQQKWRQLKMTIDYQNEEMSQKIGQKCIQKMNKTAKTRASFRKTRSSFKDSSKEWYKRVQQNKSLIHQRDQFKKDKILKNHLDISLKNKSNFRIYQTMGTMRNQAKKLADQYL